MTLSEFLRSNDMSAADFGSLIGVKSRATVFRYIQGIRFPSATVLHRIREVTDGQVTADEILKDYRKPRPVKEVAHV